MDNEEIIPKKYPSVTTNRGINLKACAADFELTKDKCKLHGILR